MCIVMAKDENQWDTLIDMFFDQIKLKEESMVSNDSSAKKWLFTMSDLFGGDARNPKEPRISTSHEQNSRCPEHHLTDYVRIDRSNHVYVLCTRRTVDSFSRIPVLSMYVRIIYRMYSTVIYRIMI